MFILIKNMNIPILTIFMSFFEMKFFGIITINTKNLYKHIIRYSNEVQLYLSRISYYMFI